MSSILGKDGVWRQCTFREELTRGVVWMLDQFYGPSVKLFYKSDHFGGDDDIPHQTLMHLLAVILFGTKPDYIGTDAPWPDEEEKGLLVGLVLLVEKTFRETDGVLSHMYMSAEEQALHVLVDAGLMVPVHGGAERQLPRGGRWTDAGNIFRKSMWHRDEIEAWLD